MVLHARNNAKATETLKSVPNSENIITGDLSSLKEVIEIAHKINELGSFDAIIHNAGVYHVSINEKTVDGLPLLFTVNSLAPYILTALIKRPMRLIYLSSRLHIQGDASEDKLNSILRGKYSPNYADTKLHDLILTLAVAKKWGEVYANAVDPGWVPTKMGGKQAPDNLTDGYKTQVWLAESNDTEVKQSGGYYHHMNKVKYNTQANDEGIQDKFLSICEKLTGVTF